MLACCSRSHVWTLATASDSCVPLRSADDVPGEGPGGIEAVLHRGAGHEAAPGIGERESAHAPAMAAFLVDQLQDSTKRCC
jgi:hypothetical protein